MAKKCKILDDNPDTSCRSAWAEVSLIHRSHTPATLKATSTYGFSIRGRRYLMGLVLKLLSLHFCDGIE